MTLVDISISFEYVVEIIRTREPLFELGRGEELDGCIGCAEFEELWIDRSTIEVANFLVFRNSHLFLIGL